MSKSFKNKLISGLLTLAMVFSMVPTNIFTAPIEVQAAEKSISDIPNVKMSFVQEDETTGQSDYKEDRLYAVQKDTGIDGLKLVAGGVKSGFAVSLWHYSGGYWGNNYKPIILSMKECPNVLCSGRVGSGKTVSVITSLLNLVITNKDNIELLYKHLIEK